MEIASGAKCEDRERSSLLQFEYRYFEDRERSSLLP